MQISDKGLALIKDFEGFSDVAYLCPAGVWTIGYGHTKGVQEGDTMSKEVAERLLKDELSQKYEPQVQKLTGGLELTQGQYDALVCFVYNVGAHSLAHSTLLKKLKEGKTEEAAAEFLRWNKARGEVQAGLVRRREAERELFLS